MANNHDRNLNITINQNDSNDEELIISIGDMLRKLKKYLPIWIVAVVVTIAGVFGYAAITTQVNKEKLTALVSFSYTGIEKGLDPNGNKFDVNTIKDPAVIEAALTTVGVPLTELDGVRQGITIKGMIPKDAIDRITMYQSVMETNGNIQAAEKILDTSYYPTQYTVSLDYNNTSLSDEDAVSVLNEILDYYATYFYTTYSYNESLGSAVSALDYEDYDYTEAVDIFTSSLRTLKSYVKQLSNDDSTHFRSANTGYTFDDLYESASTIEGIDLDKVSSYITVNNITKDKEEALAYYNYRVEALNRTKAQLEEQIKNYTDSISNYVKDQIIIFGESAENSETQITQASAQYDKMITQKNNAVNELAATKQRINYYKEKITALSNNKEKCTPEQIERVESQLKTINNKLSTLIDAVNTTTYDYLQNVSYKNAYNVLVPASSSITDKISRIISNAKMPLVLVEAAVFFLYVIISFVISLVDCNKKKKIELAEKKAIEEAEKKKELTAANK